MRRAAAAGELTRPLNWALVALVVYAIGRFVYSGLLYAWQVPNLSKFEEELPPLLTHLATGEPLRANPTQWGPVFYLIMQPLVLATGGLNVDLARWLLVIQVVCLVLAFGFTWASFRRQLASPRMRAAIVVIWLTFAPLLMVLPVKTVETWELMLLSVALYAHVRRWRWIVALALAAAGLIKAIPFVFLYYLLVTDRRTFAYSIVAVAFFLSIGQWQFGWHMGVAYLPRLAWAATGEAYLVDWHENLSVKAAFVKMLGRVDNPRLLPPEQYYGQAGYIVKQSQRARIAAVVLADLVTVGLVGWLTLTWIRARGDRTQARVVWEWSLLLVMMLIISPHTAFEYLTLALGAVTYAVVQVGSAPESAGRVTVAWLAASLFLIGVVLPRSIQNRLALIDVINRVTGYTHFTPSEAYQYYCFPLLGLVALAIAIWRLQPAARPGASH